MNRIIETIKNLSESDKAKYSKFFNNALKAFGVTNIKYLQSSKKKEFFDYVDSHWKSELEETNASAGVAGYETPNAFSGGKESSEKRIKHIATQLGYELVGSRDTLREDMYGADTTVDTDTDFSSYVIDSDGKSIENDTESFSKQEVSKIEDRYRIHVTGPLDLPQISNGIGTTGVFYKYNNSYFKKVIHKNDVLIYKSNSLDSLLRGQATLIFDSNNVNNSDFEFNERIVKESLDLAIRELTPKQQFGKAVREIRNNLTEVETLVRRTLKLKNESGLDSENYGKRAYSALSKINEKVIKLMSSLHNFK